MNPAHLVLAVVLVLVIGYLVVNPVVYLLRGTFLGPGGLTLGYLADAFSQPGTIGMLRDTVVFGAGSAIFATIIGSTLAFLVRTKTKERASGSSDRRALLIAAGAAAAVAGVMGGVGKLVSGLRVDPSDVTLPAPADPAPTFPQGLDDKIPGIAKFRTPNDSFYRIDTRLTLPTVDVEGYELVIDGTSEEAVGAAMAAAARAAAGEDVLAVSAGNYGGKLGKYHFHLHALLADA